METTVNPVGAVSIRVSAPLVGAPPGLLDTVTL
jgi:hypothetical protein